MKHRWTGGLLLAVALSLAACAPPDAGADDEATDASTTAPEESVGPTPTEYVMDEY